MGQDNLGIASLATRVMALCGERFLSPNFILSFDLLEEGVEKGFYSPVLNNWGYTEINALTWGNRVITLPWPHADTFRYLTDRTGDEEDLIIDRESPWVARVGGIKAGQVLFEKGVRATPRIETISGGTRAGVELIRKKMSRPWQPKSLEHIQQSCPFCNTYQRNYEESGDLAAFNNSATPYSWHKLVIPTPNYLRAGGDNLSHLYESGGLARVFSFSTELMRRAGIKAAELGAHIGPLAGQNLGHLHYHLINRNHKTQ